MLRVHRWLFSRCGSHASLQLVQLRDSWYRILRILRSAGGAQNRTSIIFSSGIVLVLHLLVKMDVIVLCSDICVAWGLHGVFLAVSAKLLAGLIELHTD